MGKWNRWTIEECNFLKDNIGTYSMAYIGKALGRTETAVLVKAKRLNLGSYKSNSDKITVADVCKILDIDRKGVYRMIRLGKIKYQRKRIRNKSFQYFFDYEYIVKFAEQYQKQNFRKWTPYEVSRLKFLVLIGYTYKQIGKELGRSEAAIEHKLNRTRRAS
jgi:biotin operon repressor